MGEILEFKRISGLGLSANLERLKDPVKAEPLESYVRSYCITPRFKGAEGSLLLI